MAELILINHAERVHEADPDRDRQIDRHLPLTSTGETQAQELGDRLRAAGIRPTLFLTSRNLHTKQTAEIVCRAVGGDPSVDVVEIDALTPFHPTDSFEHVCDQARTAGHDPSLHAVVAIVGHHPRLNQLFAQLTWRTVAGNRLDYAQHVRVTAGLFDGFRTGKGTGHWP